MTRDEFINELFPYVRTVEELEALPDGEVIITEQGGLWEADSSRSTLHYVRVWRECDSSGYTDTSEGIALPARVMYFPEVVDTNLEY